jgi:hypothetical protein
MFSAHIELRGHSIDSLLLPKVLGVILTCGGAFTGRDSNPSIVTKLSDRGTFQAIGLRTDIEPFLRELTEFLLKKV